MGEQRSQLLIKRQFQQSLILEVMLATFVFINLIVIIGYLLIDSIADVQQLKRYLGFAVAALEIVGFVVVYRINLRSSHRIAGPVFVIERSLRQIEVGELDFTMRLRQGDQFQEVCEQMNTTVTGLRQRIGRAQQLARQLHRQASPEPALVEQLVRELDYFRTEADADAVPGERP